MSTTIREQVPSLPTILDPRVVRGAELLDERMPGWHAGIDVDALDLFSGESCVLGQCGLCIYGLDDYQKTVSRLFDRPFTWAGTPEEKEHGFFAADYPDGKLWDVHDAGRLEQDWRLAILARRTS